VNHARRDLCGGCAAMRIPTAIDLLRKPIAIELEFCKRRLRAFNLRSQPCVNASVLSPTGAARIAVLRFDFSHGRMTVRLKGRALKEACSTASFA